MSKILKRSEVNPQNTWDLEVLFASDEIWEKEYEDVKNKISELSKYENIMTSSLENFKKTIFLNEELSQRVSKLYVYSHLKSDEDTNNTKYLSYSYKMSDLFSILSQTSAYIEIKILEMDENVLKEYLLDDELKIYEFEMKNLLKTKEHVLSQKEEELLSTLSPSLQTASQTFGLLNNADLKFEDVVDKDGKTYPLHHSRYVMYLESQDRVLRESAYKNMYTKYESLKNTFASTLSSNTKNHTIIAKLRKYNSARNAALSSNFIDESVYDSLIEAVNKKLPLLHRYLELRKKLLNLDELKMYDLAVPLIKDCDLKFSYEEAKEIIIEALKPLGKDYITILNKAFDDRWIDHCENEGKRSGAYSSGTYGTNPYILISFNGTLDNVFTLAHELGHSMHSYYTRNNQPYVYGSYTIFLAEVASITNEMLLTDYLLNKYKDNKQVTAYILNHYLDGVRGTLFRQTQFAEFEYEIHRVIEEGKALTSDVISDIYFNINKKYYGDVVTYDDHIKYEWARVPHFYYNFYVYQYATGISAASAFSKKILNKEENAVEKYIGFLKSGNSDYSLNILKKAGVDMSVNKPVFDCLENFEEKLNKLEEMMK